MQQIDHVGVSNSVAIDLRSDAKGCGSPRVLVRQPGDSQECQVRERTRHRDQGRVPDLAHNIRLSVGCHVIIYVHHAHRPVGKSPGQRDAFVQHLSKILAGYCPPRGANPEEPATGLNQGGQQLSLVRD